MIELRLSESTVDKLRASNVSLDDLKKYINKHNFSFAICEEEEDQEFLKKSYEYQRENLE